MILAISSSVLCFFILVILEHCDKTRAKMRGGGKNNCLFGICLEILLVGWLIFVAENVLD